MVKVKRWLDRDLVRKMCIEYNYYTHGDNRAYEAMLNEADNLDVENLDAVVEIARDIVFHSDISAYSDLGDMEILEGMIYGLLKDCTEMYVEMGRSDV